MKNVGWLHSKSQLKAYCEISYHSVNRFKSLSQILSPIFSSILKSSIDISQICQIFMISVAEWLFLWFPVILLLFKTSRKFFKIESQCFKSNLYISNRVSSMVQIAIGICPSLSYRHCKLVPSWATPVLCDRTKWKQIGEASDSISVQPRVDDDVVDNDDDDDNDCLVTCRFCITFVLR